MIFPGQCGYVLSPTLIPTLPTLGFGVLDSISEKLFVDSEKVQKNGGEGLEGFSRCRSVGSVGGSDIHRDS